MFTARAIFRYCIDSGTRANWVKAKAARTKFLMWEKGLFSRLHPSTSLEHTWRLLSFFSASLLMCFSWIFTLPEGEFALRRNSVQIFLLASTVKSSNLSAKWIRLCIAASNCLTRLVVRNITSWKYFSFRRETVTRVFCSIVDDRCLRKTSASSRRRMALQWKARRDMSFNFFSIIAASDPSSPALI